MKPQASMPEQIIYLVDDDDALRDSLVWLLESQGFKAAAYASAEDFLKAWKPEFNGCLLLDVRMPGPSGLDLQAALPAHKVGLPVIFMTGFADVPTSVRAMKAGAVDFLEKPVQRQTLVEAIGRALRGELQLSLSPRRLAVGGALQLTVQLQSTAARAQALLIDYAVHHVKANGERTPKVFKGWSLQLGAHEQRILHKRHSMRAVTTRRYHAGRHEVDVRVNGQVLARAFFDLSL